jgi:hypothetical protein
MTARWRRARAATDFFSSDGAGDGGFSRAASRAESAGALRRRGSVFSRLSSSAEPERVEPPRFADVPFPRLLSLLAAAAPLGDSPVMARARALVAAEERLRDETEVASPPPDETEVASPRPLFCCASQTWQRW